MTDALFQIIFEKPCNCGIQGSSKPPTGIPGKLSKWQIFPILRIVATFRPADGVGMAASVKQHPGNFFSLKFIVDIAIFDNQYLLLNTLIYKLPRYCRVDV